MKLAAVIWDWNGTLLDDVDYAISCMNRLLARRGMALLDRERYRSIFGFPVERYYQRLGFDFQEESFAQLSREFIEHYYHDLAVPRLHAGAMELVSELNTAGIVQCILSAMESDPLHRQLELNGCHDTMKLVQGLDHSHATSKLDVGKALLKQLGKPAEGVLFIGDTTHDREVAENLGLEAVFLTHGHQAAELFRGYAYNLVQDIAELRKYLVGKWNLLSG